jgi:hypothetical protein
VFDFIFETAKIKAVYAQMNSVKIFVNSYRKVMKVVLFVTVYSKEASIPNDAIVL